MLGFRNAMLTINPDYSRNFLDTNRNCILVGFVTLIMERFRSILPQVTDLGSDMLAAYAYRRLHAICVALRWLKKNMGWPRTEECEA